MYNNHRTAISVVGFYCPLSGIEPEAMVSRSTPKRDMRPQTTGFEPMMPVRCRMLDHFITLAAWFKANP